MIKSRSKDNSGLLKKADKALRSAVRKVMAEKKLRGQPAIIWKDGKVVKVPANKI